MTTVRLLDTRRLLLLPAAVLALGFAGTAVTAGSEEQSPAAQATDSLTATATFGPRTSLEVSSQVLRFQVPEASTAAEATVSFAAGARTRTDGEVELVFENRGPGRSASGRAIDCRRLRGNDCGPGAVRGARHTDRGRALGRRRHANRRRDAPPPSAARPVRTPGQISRTHSLTAALRAYGSRVTQGFSPMTFPTDAAAFTASARVAYSPILTR